MWLSYDVAAASPGAPVPDATMAGWVGVHSDASWTIDGPSYSRAAAHECLALTCLLSACILLVTPTARGRLAVRVCIVLRSIARIRGRVPVRSGWLFSSSVLQIFATYDSYDAWYESIRLPSVHRCCCCLFPKPPPGLPNGSLVSKTIRKDSSSGMHRTVYRSAVLWCTGSRTIPTRIPHRAHATRGPPTRVQSMATDSTGAPRDDPLVQYVALRKDVVVDWPVGAVAAQAAHAATAALWMSRDAQTTAAYCAADNIDYMRKVVLEAPGETSLLQIAAKLEEAGICHKLWVEQPENVPTALAAAPNRKSVVGPFFKKLKLCGSTSSKK